MKIVLIGDSAVGKTALVYRFVNNKLLTESKATLGIAFVKQRIVHPGEEIIKGNSKTDIQTQTW